MDNSVLQLDITDENGDKVNRRISMVMKVSLGTKETKIVTETGCSVDTINCLEGARQLDILATYIIPLGRKTIRVIIPAFKDFKLWLSLEKEAERDDFDLTLTFNVTSSDIYMNGTLLDVAEARVNEEKLYIFFEDITGNSTFMSIRLFEDASDVNVTTCDVIKPDVMAMKVASIDRRYNTWEDAVYIS